MRIAIVGSCSGQGKTTLARILADRLGATFVEFDSLRHGPNWTTTPDEKLREILSPIVATDSWVIDNLAERLGVIVERVELIVWLDLPPWIWLPRLLKRSAKRVLFREELWNGNRESLRGIFLDHDGVLPWAFRSYFFRRSDLAERMSKHAMNGIRVIRLCTVREVDQFLQMPMFEAAYPTSTQSSGNPQSVPPSVQKLKQNPR